MNHTFCQKVILGEISGQGDSIDFVINFTSYSFLDPICRNSRNR